MKKYNIKRRFKKARARSRAMARRRKKNSRNYVSPVKIGIIGVLVLCVMVLLTRGTEFFKGNVVDVYVTVQDAQMYVGEDKPVFEAMVTCNGDVETILDEDTAYRIQDLLDELNLGNGYTLESDGDGTEVGEYSIRAELTSAVSTPMDTDWFDKVKIHTISGTLTVKEIDEEYLASEEAKKNRPMIALTFDDGPGANTMRLLEALEEKGAKATFFMVGQNVSKYPETVKKMYEIGCDLGNHTYNHEDLSTLSAEGIQSQINDTNTQVEEAAGHPSTLLRPPYGSANETVSQNAGMPLILWNVDTQDWKTRDTQASIDHVLANAGDGDIVLMHDIYSTSVDAAIELIDLLQDKGYSLVTISELAKARGYDLANGQKYYGFFNN